MNDLPLSIILPNYNHGHFLPLSIESVLSQSFSAFELIIVDDGSTDKSLAIIHDYLKKDKRIRLLRHAKNQGIAEAIKTGLSVARGTYLHGLSATDCHLPRFLEKSLQALFKYPEIGLCCSDSGLFDTNPSDFVNYPIIENASHRLLLPPSKIQKVFKYARFSISGCSAIMKRSAFLLHGGYRKNLHFLCDCFLNYQIALFEGAIYIPETLTVFRTPGYSKKASMNPQIRKEAFQNLIAVLLEPQNRELLRRMRRAALLGILGKECVYELLKRPRLWTLYIGLGERYLYTRLCRALKRALVSEKFLQRHHLPG
jgi:glycosyltransferase involved in cell wall biosynthesis